MIGQSLSLRGIRKSYGATYAVHETDLDIAAGEFVSIVGPSGSGKTTLLTMIAGFEPPTTGSIAVGNKDVTRLAPNRRDIGMVFQRYALFPHMTVRGNLEFPLRMRKRNIRGDLGRRVDDMLDLVQLSSLAHRYPHQLSGGQQQRVAVGRALVFNPPVLLMDEPLGALDKKLREAMQLEIKRLQQQLGATIVYVTHDQEEALTLSDRVAVMHDGQLEQIGSPLELYAEPQSTFVADFVGTISFIPGAIVGYERGAAAIRIASGAIIEISTDNTEPVPAGTDVLIAVRPEDIRICLPGSEASGLTGTLENQVFSGASRIAHVRLLDMEGLTLRIQIPNDFSRLPELGGTLAVALPADKLKMFHAGNGRRL